MLGVETLGMDLSAPEEGLRLASAVTRRATTCNWIRFRSSYSHRVDPAWEQTQ
jgi:hypothetical protein